MNPNNARFPAPEAAYRLPSAPQPLEPPVSRAEPTPPVSLQQPQQQPRPHPQKLTQSESIRELKKTLSNVQEVLLTATTVFPFTLVPDTVTLDREKLTISHRIFFRVAEVMSIRIEDILNVTADVGPFFGSIKVSTRFFDVRKPYSVDYLWRWDALRFKRVVQGYIIALQKGIDCSPLSSPQLADLLDELGQGAPHESDS